MIKTMDEVIKMLNVFRKQTGFDGWQVEFTLLDPNHTTGMRLGPVELAELFDRIGQSENA